MERSEGGAGTISKRYTVTSTQTPHGPIYQILDKVTGAVLMTFAYPKGQFKKTGKHYDIASILEAMRE